MKKDKFVISDSELNLFLDNKGWGLEKIKGASYIITNNKGEDLGDAKYNYNSGDKIWNFVLLD